MGLYIHFPWCLAKCPYCDFLSLAQPDPSQIPQQAYTRAVVNELGQRRDLIAEQPVHSVFFGGGTPSLWSPNCVAQVLSAVRANYPLAPGAEITLEANPTSFTREKGQALLEAGVNRVSIGVQGLDAERLRFLGRWHEPQGALRALNDAQEAGFSNVSADLIYGVFRQNPETARAEAEAIVGCGVSHLSAYLLTIEPGTAFGASHRKGKLPLLDDALVAESFTAVHDALQTMGFEHYEISNFAKPGRTSRHNLGYWRGEPYLGIGLGAFGTLPAPTGGGTRVRYRNTANVERYLGIQNWPQPSVELAGNGQVYHQVEPLSDSTALTERLMLGLRLSEGVCCDALDGQFGAEWRARLPVVERLLARGRLVQHQTRLRIPYPNWLFADGIISELV